MKAPGKQCLSRAAGLHAGPVPAEVSQGRHGDGHTDKVVLVPNVLTWSQVLSFVARRVYSPQAESGWMNGVVKNPQT